MITITIISLQIQSMSNHYLSASQIGKVWEARNTAEELTAQIENLPCWILEQEDWAIILDSMKKTRKILNTSKEVKSLQPNSPYSAPYLSC